MNRFRTCPCCKQPGVEVQDLYPNGTNCLYCTKHIEINAFVTIAIIFGLVSIMMLDFNYLEIDVLGLICAFLLLVIGAGLQWVYPNLMPLKHYEVF
ncbi:MAG: hypothetical protein JKY88_15680 [Pseudomonadales bacterium]|nr:hypothetical protein [Pseudomonadales bacterium]